MFFCNVLKKLMFTNNFCSNPALIVNFFGIDFTGKVLYDHWEIAFDGDNPSYRLPTCSQRHWVLWVYSEVGLFNVVEKNFDILKLELIMWAHDNVVINSDLLIKKDNIDKAQDERGFDLVIRVSILRCV